MQGQGFPVQVRCRFIKGLGKGRIRMIIRQEPAGPVPMNQEQDARMDALTTHGG